MAGEVWPPSGLENTTRSYAKIIDQVNRFDGSELVAPEAAASNKQQGLAPSALARPKPAAYG